jgi:Tol biopolymer transport system component
MRTSARTCTLLGAGLAALVVAAGPAGATYRGTNGLIAYQAQVGKHTQLFTVRPDGHGRRQITHLGDSNALNAAWSPDGKQIAFARDYAAGTSHEHLDIFTVDANGSGLHAMGLKGLNGEPTWSPDGRHVLWARPGAFEIANADGTGLRTVPVAGDIGTPTFSPDATRIGFLRTLAGDKGAIYVMRADGTHVRRLTKPARGVGSKIDWSPDGSTIAFSAVTGSSSNIFTIRPNGTGLKQITNVPAKVNDLLDSWSPDGKQIAFISDAAGAFEVYVMNADGSGATQVTNGPESHLAAWGTHA